MPLLRTKGLLQKGVNLMIVYYVIALVANIISLIVLSNCISITIVSIVPVIVFILLAIWSFYYKEQSRQKYQGDTAYTVKGDRFSKEEQNNLHTCLSNSFSMMIPLCVPFIFFFPNHIEAFSVVLYFVGIILGRGMFDCRYKKEVEERLSREKRELEEQIKKEEIGKL